jgi:hypothetical protein
MAYRRRLASALQWISYQLRKTRGLDGWCREAPASAFWASTITNIDHPKIVSEELRLIDSPAMLEVRHPPYHKEDMLDRVQQFAQTEENLGLCVKGRFQDARRKAESGEHLEHPYSDW